VLIYPPMTRELRDEIRPQEITQPGGDPNPVFWRDCLEAHKVVHSTEGKVLKLVEMNQNLVWMGSPQTLGEIYKDRKALLNKLVQTGFSLLKDIIGNHIVYYEVSNAPQFT